jgi:hypothetical protein
MVTADKLENAFQCCGAWMNQGGALPLIIAIIGSSFFGSSLLLGFFETHHTITHFGLKFKGLWNSNSIFIIKDNPGSFPAAAQGFTGAAQDLTAAAQDFPGAVQDFTAAAQDFTGAAQGFTAAAQDFTGAAQSSSAAARNRYRHKNDSISKINERRFNHDTLSENNYQTCRN